MSNFVLSDKEVETDASTAVKLHYAKAYLKEDVKEFITRLVKWIEITDHMREAGKYEHVVHKSHLKRKIRKLAGKELVEVRE